jgi:hypothetical protein
MGTTTAMVTTTEKYHPPILEAGATKDEVVFDVDPDDPNQYVVYFSKLNVFNESVKLLKPGKNVFKRKSGSTLTTTYSVTALVTPSIREIPPK